MPKEIKPQQVLNLAHRQPRFGHIFLLVIEEVDTLLWVIQHHFFLNLPVLRAKSSIGQTIASWAKKWPESMILGGRFRCGFAVFLYWRMKCMKIDFTGPTTTFFRDGFLCGRQFIQVCAQVDKTYPTNTAHENKGDRHLP